MERSELKKFVYEDDGNTKVLKCYILSEDEFVYNVEAIGTKAKITIGKRAIVKICGGGPNGY